MNLFIDLLTVHTKYYWNYITQRPFIYIRFNNLNFFINFQSLFCLKGLKGC